MLPETVALPVDVAAQLAHPVLVRSGVVLGWKSSQKFNELSFSLLLQRSPTDGAARIVH